jgi:UDP-N-acetylglucosamine 4-epimerase
MSIVGLRYFNVFGPKQNINGAYAAVIPIFISKLLNNEQCHINGDGKISRDFTYVDNVVQANILTAFNYTNSKHELFNIAMGDQLSLNDLYVNLENKIKTGLSPIHQDARLGDIQNSRADISKAKEGFSYNPTVSVQDGLEKTVNWYKKNMS